jgi:hypothetical protein
MSTASGMANAPVPSHRAITSGSNDLGYLLLQINVICLLLALIGTTAIVQHLAWFGGVPVAAQSIAER